MASFLLRWCLVPLAAATAAFAASEPLFVGPEFQVNVVTAGDQVRSSVAADAAGNFVVVWESSGQDGDGAGVFARRYDATGTPLGGEFQVNGTVAGDQAFPALAMDGSGRFLVVWESADVSSVGIFARRYDAAGVPQGPEFQVNTTTASAQFDPAVGVDGAGDFVVAWISLTDILAQRLDAAGVPLGGEIEVDLSGNWTRGTAVAADAAGRFLIAYVDIDDNLLSRGFDASGNPLATSQLISSDGVNAAATAGAAGFVVAYRESDASTAIARFDATTGVHVSTLHFVNTFSTPTQAQVAISAIAGGGFVLAWEGAFGIAARRLDAMGIPTSGELRVNATYPGVFNDPGVAAGPGGDFVVTWTSDAQDGSGGGIFAQRYLASGGTGTALLGDRLLIRNGTSPSQRLLSLRLSDNGIVLPKNVGEDPRCPPEGSGSPAAGGALRVVGPGGDFTIDLPCANWSRRIRAFMPTRYVYRDPSGATCRRLTLEDGPTLDEGRLKATCRGAQVAYTLGGAPGDIAVLLTTGAPGTARGHCASFGPATLTDIVRDGSTGTVYLAEDAALIPRACP